MEQSPLVTVAIVYHSGYGHTARQAAAVADGARSIESTEVLVVRVEDVQDHWGSLVQADAIVFGTPTYMGSASAAFKGFMEATSRRIYVTGAWRDKIAAGFTNSASRSGDKLATLQQLAVFAAQHGMHWVNLGLPPGHNTSKSTEDTLNRHGFFLGAGAQSNADEGADTAPPESDLRTAHHLGQRVATVAKQLQLGRGWLSAPPGPVLLRQR
jgi:multimeric flavodoxin WrbA